MEDKIKEFMNKVAKMAGELFGINDVEFKITDVQSRIRVDTPDWRVVTVAMRKPQIPTIGFSNLTRDMQHVVFLDYDHVDEGFMMDELYGLVEQFKLTNFYVFYTRRSLAGGRWYGNYHAVSLTKVPYGECMRILRLAHTDEAFRDSPLYITMKHWVLRLYPKANIPSPTFLCIVPDKPVNMDREISRAHLNLLKSWYPNIPDLPYQNLDNSTDLMITYYKTGKI
jgi:hypothetical protein